MARAGLATLASGVPASMVLPTLPSLCSNQGFLLGTLRSLSKVLNSFYLSGASLSASSRLPSWVTPGPGALCFLQSQIVTTKTTQPVFHWAFVYTPLPFPFSLSPPFFMIGLPM